MWDKAAEIDFVSPGRESVTATFELTQGVVDEVVEAVAGGDRLLRWFEVDAVTADGTVVATIRKQVYVRLKR